MCVDRLSSRTPHPGFSPEYRGEGDFEIDLFKEQTMKKSWLLGLAVLVLAGAVGVYAQQGSPGRSNKVVLENCLISAFEQVALPGREPGVLSGYEDNVAREGMEVKAGEVLAHLDK